MQTLRQIILLLLLAFVLGCSDESSVTKPTGEERVTTGGDATQNQQHNRSSNSPGGLSSSVQRAKDALIETSRKMDGDFVVVMIDIVQSAETGGTPMSICDQRAYDGHFSFETLAAYQKWRSAMLADANGGVRPIFPRLDTNSTD